MSKNKDETQKESIRGAVGGQAVIEGVMMKSKESIAIAVRKENGEIVKKIKPYKSVRDKYKILNTPVIRGAVNFVEMLSMSMSTLNDSAEMLGLGETEDEKNAGAGGNEENNSKLTLIASIVGTILGLALSFVLFFFLPTFVGNRLKILFPQISEMGWLISIIEGITRLTIFIIYILLVSMLKDIKRTFQYHGAEHMSVFCCEAEEELTVENAKKYSRFHPRCGTSFLIVMMVVGVIISSLIPASFGLWSRLIIKIMLFPVIIGIGYEFIRYAGRHDSLIVKIISAPGLWIQRLTTKAPDDSQIEVAIVSLRAALNVQNVDENAD